MNCLAAERKREYVQDRPALRMVEHVPAKRSRRTKNAGRRLVENAFFFVAAAAVIWCASSTLLQSISSVIGAKDVSTVRMTVQPGDTLWKIAGRLTGSGQQVDEMNSIRSLNPSLQSDQALKAGQLIVVPVNRSLVDPDIHLAKAGAERLTSM